MGEPLNLNDSEYNRFVDWAMRHDWLNIKSESIGNTNRNTWLAPNGNHYVYQCVCQDGRKNG